ncbi:hypothetical protein IJO12_00490 [bacterium]|nr:hypothetical protein [bacterium]
MQLTNIEYGSLASSAVLNNNFTYLDEKIAETDTNLNSSISAILSNIETINSRLSQLAENVSTTRSDLELGFNDFKSKSLAAFNKVTMLPNWSNIISVTDLNSFTALTNGYLLLIQANGTAGNIKINNFEFTLEQVANAYDSFSETMTIPLKKGDIVSSSIQAERVYFLPALNIISTEL